MLQVMVMHSLTRQGEQKLHFAGQDQRGEFPLLTSPLDPLDLSGIKNTVMVGNARSVMHSEVMKTTKTSVLDWL